METLEITIPVEVGSEVYRTNDKCAIEVGVIQNVNIEAKSYFQSTSACTREFSPAKDNVRIRIYVKWEGYRATEGYNMDAVGTEVFTSKESLIKHLVGKL